MRSFCLSSSSLNFSASATIFNFISAETAFVIGDGDFFLLVRRLVSGRNIEDPIGVNVKSHFNLGYTSWCWRNTCQVKLAQGMVVFGHGSFSLVDLNGNSGLVVRKGGKGLSLLGGNGGVPLDKGGHDTSSSFNTHAQGSD